MKSLCIKTNNKITLSYLLNNLKNIELENICFSENHFKNYKNIIIHYTGSDDTNFFSKISSCLSLLILDEYEDKILSDIFLQNYFYFETIEQKKILDISSDIMSEDFHDIFNKKLEVLYNDFYNYISNNKSIVLEGFINFRLKNYNNILENVLNEAINNFLIEKEYLEFISLLKLYINSQNPSTASIHVVYSSFESILLDENKNIIISATDISKVKYLSDISFSSNDYTLNSLLTILPSKIYVHLVDNHIDEFINTLQLIFENRITICNACDICDMYRNIENTKTSETSK